MEERTRAAALKGGTLSGAAVGDGMREGGFEAAGPRNDLVLFGVPFWNPSYDEFKGWWDRVLASDERAGKCLMCANAHTLNHAWTMPEFKDAIRAAEVRMNDGIGFRIASRFRGVRIRYNFNGTDLVPRLLTETKGPLRIFLYGATEKANELAAERIQEMFPNVQVVGRISGYVDVANEAVPAIAASGADLVMVALGHPKQELFSAQYASQLNTKIVYPVGGLFDFISGCKPRAPHLLRAASLEWLYRLVLEPRRMFVRYVVGNPVFLMRSILLVRADRQQAELFGAEGASAR